MSETNELPQTPGGYATISADPPWPYTSPRAVVGNGGRGGEGAEEIIQADVGQHYSTMSIADLKRLPVGQRAATNAHLYLWTTNSFIVEAHEIARAWGFIPKTIVTWVKHKKGQPDEPSMKTGYWFRSATEHILFAVRGSLRLSIPEGVPTVFYSPRLPHSVKPDEARVLMERCSPGPRLEMFARRRVAGWDVWGDQVPTETQHRIDEGNP